METRPGDTDQETHAVWLEYLRSRGPGKRLEDVLRLCEQTRELSLAGIRMRHPQYSAQDAEMALRRWWWGDTLFDEVHPKGPRLAP